MCNALGKTTKLESQWNNVNKAQPQEKEQIPNMAHNSVQTQKKKKKRDEPNKTNKETTNDITKVQDMRHVMFQQNRKKKSRFESVTKTNRLLPCGITFFFFFGGGGFWEFQERDNNV